MSKFIFPPQIQQLKAANAGVIAFADGGLLPIGIVPVAFSAQFVGFNISLFSVEAVVASILSDGGTHALGVPSLFTEVFSQFNQVISFSISQVLEALTGMPSESMALGVATFTDYPV